MSTDPKDPRGLFANRTLWLDAESMDVARERFWQAFLKLRSNDRTPRVHADDLRGGLRFTVRHNDGTVHATTMAVDDVRAIWDICWTAAIAAQSYVSEGNLGPEPSE